MDGGVCPNNAATDNPSTATEVVLAHVVIVDFSSSGEFTSCSGLAGKGWPGSTPGRVGPRPVADNTSVSPARAGLVGLTGVKLAWKTETTSGRWSGMR